MESRVLPAAEISDLLAREFVALKVNIDNPPADVEKILSQVNGNILPFYAYVSPEGKFISGTSGYRDEAVFKADLLAALKSEPMRAPAEAEKKLAKAADLAAKDLDAGKFASVIRAARDAEKTRGWSESNGRLRELLGQAETAGRKALGEAAAQAKEDKLDDALAAAKKVQGDFKGTEVEAEAAGAVKCLDRLKTAAANAAQSDTAGARRLYELILKEAKDTPYAPLAEAKLKGLGG